MLLIPVIFSVNWLLDSMHQECHQQHRHQGGAVTRDNEALVGYLFEW